MLEALEVAAVPPCFMCKYSLLLEVECKKRQKQNRRGVACKEGAPQYSRFLGASRSRAHREHHGREHGAWEREAER